MREIPGLLFVFVAVTALPASGFAQDPVEASDTERDAREVFELGRRAQADGRFEDAAQYFERAYELSPRPELLYNMGVAYERADDPEASLTSFERYLAEPGATERRGEVQERVRVLRLRARGEPDSETAHPRPESRDDGHGVAPWIVSGLGVAVAIGGSAFLFLANDAASDVEGSPRGTEWADVEGQAKNADTFSLVGALLLGAGSAAVAAGLVWAIASGGADEELTAALVPGGALIRGRM